MGATTPVNRQVSRVPAALLFGNCGPRAGRKTNVFQGRLRLLGQANVAAFFPSFPFYQNRREHLWGYYKSRHSLGRLFPSLHGNK